MSRKPKTPDYQISKIKGNRSKDNFFRIYASLFENDRFRSLTSTAKVVYIAIGLQCGREDEYKMKCCFPQSQYEELGFTKRQVIRAVSELEDAGFLTVKRSKCRTPNEYHLSDEWKIINQ